MSEVLWKRKDEYADPPGCIVFDFFWVVNSHGDVVLAHGNPGRPGVVHAECAGDREGIYSEKIGDFEWFAWLEAPQPPPDVS